MNLRRTHAIIQGELLKTLDTIERLCFDEELTNAFLVRAKVQRCRQRVHVLSDLRLVHLINQSITPDRAGERYEAYIVDYSLFMLGNDHIKEMVPEEGQGQFKACRSYVDCLKLRKKHLKQNSA